MQYPKVYEFEWKKAGKTAVIFWAIHGNDICGPQVLEKLIQDIQCGKIIIESGKLIIVPICNPKAYQADVRQMEDNLNRVFYEKKDKNNLSYEEKIAEFLKKYIDAGDYILDLHSFHAQGNHYIFQDFTDEKTNEFISALWVKNIVQGWPELYEAWEELDTIWYAYSQGKIGALIECGSHRDPECFDIANKTIQNFLIFSEIISGKWEKNIQNITKIDSMIRKEKPGNFTKNYIEMQEITAWEVIVKYDDWEEFIAKKDGNILLTNKDAKIWQEHFYIAYKKNN